MKQSKLYKMTPVAAAMAALVAAPAFAQEAKKDDSLNLDRVVVTASPMAKSKMRSAVSVTDVDLSQVTDFAPRSEAEVLHLIPGIRAESSAGPGGNSNISVRGLSIASGGSKFVQFQEDGLPTVAFGDMNFANNDYWFRFDYNIDKVQTVRGGTASTAASHAPGAIINFISKTGETQGGSVGLTRGIGYDETRFDGSYGGKLAPDLRFHIGGYFRDGQGPRDTQINGLHGYQIKGNVTKTFNGNAGFFRVNFKVLNENAPTYTGMPALGTRSGNTVGDFKPLPGYDIRTETQYSIYAPKMSTVGPIGTAVGESSLHRGISVDAKALGFEFQNDVGGGLLVNNKFRYNSQGGAFQTTFQNFNSLEGVLADRGAAVARYANGPRAGQIVTAGNLQTGFISTDPAINTQTPNMNHWVNDLSASKKFGNVTARGGLYTSSQKVVQVWQVSPLIKEVGVNGALIDLFSASGAKLTSMGLAGFNNNWGDCCARSIDANFNTTAPYAALDYVMGNWDFDASVRRDTVKATGSFAGGTADDRKVDVNGNGVIDGAEGKVMLVNSSAIRPLDYTASINSYSLGANYRLNSDASVFVRTSKGGRITADRFDFGKIDTFGRIVAGATPSFISEVTQLEIGVKQRGKIGGGNYGLFATYFNAGVDEYDFDQTRLSRGEPLTKQISYKSSGLELESVFNIGAFGINANAVYTTSKLPNGKTPGGQAKWLYTLAPRYTIGALTFGAVLRGHTSVPNSDDNTLFVKGRNIVNAFASYELTDKATLSINAGNVLNTIASSGQIGTTANPNVYNFRPEAGRTVSATVRYAF